VNIFLPDQLNVGYIRNFAKTFEVEIFFIKRDPRYRESYGPLDDNETIADIAEKEVEISLSKAVKEDDEKERRRQYEYQEVNKKKELYDPDFYISASNNNYGLFFKDFIVNGPVYELDLNKKILGQTLNIYRYTDLRVLTDILKQKDTDKDYYIVDFDHTLASYLVELYDIENSIPTESNTAYIFYPGAEDLLEFDKDQRLIILTHRGDEKKNLEKSGVELARDFLNKTGNNPPVISAFSTRLNSQMPKGKVLVNFLENNKFLLEYIDTFHFIDDDIKSIKSVGRELVLYFSSKGLRKTINLYHGIAWDTFKVIQGKINPEKIPGIFSPIEIDFTPEPVIPAQSRLISPPSVSNGGMTQSQFVPPIPQRAQPPFIPSMSSMYRAPTSPRSSQSVIPIRGVSRTSLAEMGPEVSRAPSRTVFDYIQNQTEKRIVRELYNSRPVRYEGLKCENFIDKRNVKIRECSYLDSRAIKDLVDRSGPDSLFVIDFDDTLFTRFANLFIKGYPTPSIADFRKINLGNFFPYPGTLEILQKPEIFPSTSPKIFILTNRNAQGVEEAKEVLKTFDLNARVYGIIKQESKGQKLAEILRIESEWLRGVKNIYFIDDGDTHIRSVKEITGAYLSTLSNGTTLTVCLGEGDGQFVNLRDEEKQENVEDYYDKFDKIYKL